MGNFVNYQKLMEEQLNYLKSEETVPQLLLHSCCGPCSSVVLERLNKFFNITLFFYNPNIHPAEEFYKRLSEQRKLITKLGYEIKITYPEYNAQEFFDYVVGLEAESEGGERCKKCFKLRMEKTAKEAQTEGLEYFTTTLTTSPYKNAETINKIGESLSEDYNIKFLNTDFKKKNGYKRSIELSNQYNIYRQNYCGCVFSKQLQFLRKV